VVVRANLLFVLTAVLTIFPGQLIAQDPAITAPHHLGEKADIPPDSETAEQMKKSMEKERNEKREAQLKRDTEKLLQLSTELKQYVDKTNRNLLSVDVIKKAEEIEKLAHSVKEKMKGN